MGKIIKTSKIILSVLKVLFWVIAVISVVSLAAIFIALLFKEDPTLLDGVSILIGSYSLLLKEEYSLQQFIPLLCVTLINVTVFGVFSCYIIRILQAIFKPMSQGKPFSIVVSNALKRLSYAVLLLGIVGIVLQIVTNQLFFDAFDVASLFAKDRVMSCSVSIVSDGSFVLWFIILRLVGNIFQYGETLQKLSDETL